MAKNIIYADNNATTPIAPEVVEAIQPFLTEHFFNPSSMYSPARECAVAIDKARAEVANLLGVSAPDQIIFTSCATESNNAALFGAVRAARNRKHIITTMVEHPAILEVCKELERDGAQITYLPVDRSGQLDKVAFVRALRPDTLMVSVMHANNESGVIFPVSELARITKETDPGIIFHTDATQSVGKIPIDMEGEFKNVDMLSLSGHKLHGPKGVGALYVKRGTPVRPYMIGGHQEKSRRAGTQNTPFIVALGEACRIARVRIADELHIAAMRDRLEEGILATVPWVEVNGKNAPRLPNTLNIACHFVEGEGILYQLDEYGICASSGSACTSGSLEPSHVLRAMQLPFTAIHGSVRFSFSRYNTESDVDAILAVFPQVIANLRKLSPYWDNEQNKPRPEAPGMTSE
jgi:cysteine desulfurase